MKFLPDSRNCRLVLFAVLALRFTSVRAQDVAVSEPTVPGSLLKTVPLLYLQEINLSYENFYKHNRSWQFGTGYIYKVHANAGAVGEPRRVEVSGISLRVSHRWYNGKRFASPQGNYHGPLATYRYMAFPKTQEYDEFAQPHDVRVFQQVFSLQYIWGLQRVFGSTFVVDAYVGAGGRIKYTYENPGYITDANMTQGVIYGKDIAVGPDWVVLLAPSISMNIAFGLAL